MNLNDKSGIELTYNEVIHIVTALHLVVDLPAALFKLYAKACQEKPDPMQTAIHQDTSMMAFGFKGSAPVRAALKKALALTREIGNERAHGQQRWGTRELILNLDYSDLPSDSLDRAMVESALALFKRDDFPYNRDGTKRGEGGTHG